MITSLTEIALSWRQVPELQLRLESLTFHKVVTLKNDNKRVYRVNIIESMLITTKRLDHWFLVSFAEIWINQDAIAMARRAPFHVEPSKNKEKWRTEVDLWFRLYEPFYQIRIACRMAEEFDTDLLHFFNKSCILISNFTWLFQPKLSRWPFSSPVATGGFGGLSLPNQSSNPPPKLKHERL